MRAKLRCFAGETDCFAVLLRACRPTLGIGPILWLPMTRQERSRCLRWRLGWMPSGKPWPCRNCPTGDHFSRQHAIFCLWTHSRLQIPIIIIDPISFVLNKLPTSPPRSSRIRNYWRRVWSALCLLLTDIDRLCRPEDE